MAKGGGEMRNYSGHGWEGSNYEHYQNITDVAKKLRKWMKEEFPKCKFSVRISRYSMGQSMTVALMAAPFSVFTGGYWKEDIDAGYRQVNHYYIENDECLTEKAKAVLKKVAARVSSFNYDDSDSMIDYFDTDFYFHLEVGKWDRPFTKVA